MNTNVLHKIENGNRNSLQTFHVYPKTYRDPHKYLRWKAFQQQSLACKENVCEGPGHACVALSISLL